MHREIKKTPKNKLSYQVGRRQKAPRQKVEGRSKKAEG